MAENWTEDELKVIREIALRQFHGQLRLADAVDIAFARLHDCGGKNRTWNSVDLRLRRDIAQLVNPSLPLSETLYAQTHQEQRSLFDPGQNDA